MLSLLVLFPFAVAASCGPVASCYPLASAVVSCGVVSLARQLCPLGFLLRIWVGFLAIFALFFVPPVSRRQAAGLRFCSGLRLRLAVLGGRFSCSGVRLVSRLWWSFGVSRLTRSSTPLLVWRLLACWALAGAVAWSGGFGTLVSSAHLAFSVGCRALFLLRGLLGSVFFVLGGLSLSFLSLLCWNPSPVCVRGPRAFPSSSSEPSSPTALVSRHPLSPHPRCTWGCGAWARSGPLGFFLRRRSRSRSFFQLFLLRLACKVWSSAACCILGDGCLWSGCDCACGGALRWLSILCYRSASFGILPTFRLSDLVLDWSPSGLLRAVSSPRPCTPRGFGVRGWAGCTLVALPSPRGVPRCPSRSLSRWRLIVFRPAACLGYRALCFGSSAPLDRFCPFFLLRVLAFRDLSYPAGGLWNTGTSRCSLSLVGWGVFLCSSSAFRLWTLFAAATWIQLFGFCLLRRQSRFFFRVFSVVELFCLYLCRLALGARPLRFFVLLWSLSNRRSMPPSYSPSRLLGPGCVGRRLPCPSGGPTRRRVCRFPFASRLLDAVCSRSRSSGSFWLSSLFCRPRMVLRRAVRCAIFVCGACLVPGSFARALFFRFPLAAPRLSSSFHSLLSFFFAGLPPVTSCFFCPLRSPVSALLVCCWSVYVSLG